MAAAIDDFEKDNQAKVLVLNGEGGSFCSGFDIDEIGEKGYNSLKDAAVCWRCFFCILQSHSICRFWD